MDYNRTTSEYRMLEHFLPYVKTILSLSFDCGAHPTYRNIKIDQMQLT